MAPSAGITGFQPPCLGSPSTIFDLMSALLHAWEVGRRVEGEREGPQIPFKADNLRFTKRSLILQMKKTNMPNDQKNPK